MLREIWQWIKGLFQRLFGIPNQVEGARSQTSSRYRGIEGETLQPLSDSDYEYLFRQLLEGVSHGWQQERVLQWFETLKHRTPKAEWVAWLGRFGARVLESPAPNNELAARLVQLGEIIISIPSIREIGEAAYNIGIQLLNRNPGEPILEYEGPDASPLILLDQGGEENTQEAGAETITLDELFVRLQEDENLRQIIAQQLGIETTDPQVMIQALIEQFHPPDDSTTSDVRSEPVEKAEPTIDEVEGDLWTNSTISNPPEIYQPSPTEWEEMRFDEDEDLPTTRDARSLPVEKVEPTIDEIEKDLLTNSTITNPPEIYPPSQSEWEEVRFDQDGNLAAETLAKAAPTNPIDNTEIEQAAVWYNQAIQQAMAEDLLEAIACWDKALELKPDLHEAWLNRGLALDNLGRFEEAIASYDKSLELKHDTHEVWYNRGIALKNLGRVKEAITSFEKALELKPDYYQALHNLGISLKNLGRFEEAIASFEKALEFKPDYYEAWYNRGVAVIKGNWQVLRKD